MSDQMNSGLQPQKKNSPLAIAALVLAILAIVSSFTAALSMGIPTIIFALIGLILSIVAKKQGATGGVVTAALVISIISLVLGGIALIACLACFAAGSALEGNLEGWADDLAGEIDRVASEQLADLG